VLFLEYNFLLIPERVIQKEKSFVEQEERRARHKGKYVPFEKGVSFVNLKVSRGEKKKKLVEKNRDLTCGNAAPRIIYSF